MIISRFFMNPLPKIPPSFENILTCLMHVHAREADRLHRPSLFSVLVKRFTSRS